MASPISLARSCLTDGGFAATGCLSRIASRRQIIDNSQPKLRLFLSSHRHATLGTQQSRSGQPAAWERRDAYKEAKRAGKVFAEVLGGAIAFRRKDDPEAGIMGQGVIIGRYGVMADTTDKL